MKTRVGEIGGYTLGFLGGLFNKKGNYIISHGHTGAFHLWKNIGQDDSDSEGKIKVVILQIFFFLL